MGIKIYLTDDKTNETTMECIFTHEKITYECKDEKMVVTKPNIIADMTNNILEALYRNVRAYELSQAVVNGDISLKEMVEIIDNEFGTSNADEIDEGTVIISSRITQ